MADGSTFDPRHDAVFQRGYEAGTTPHVGTSSADAAARVPATAAADPLRQDLADLNNDRPAPPLAELANTELHEAALVPPQRPSMFNPFIVALWVLGPLLFIGGAWLQLQAARQSYNVGYDSSGEMPIDMVIQQILWTLTPAMMGAGFTTVLGLLFWHAWQWRAARH